MTASSSSPALRLALLRRLGEEFPEWGVWKNIDRMLAGSGDIDSLGRRSSWNEMDRTYRDWAFSNGFTGVVRCEHVPGVLILMAVSGEQPTMSELDVCDECYWRGSRLFTATDVESMMIPDRRGFRMLRPGAQGLFLLLLSGLRRGGRVDRHAIQEKEMRELLSADPEGVLDAARALGHAADDAVRLAHTVLRNGWDRRTAISLEARAITKALVEPVGLIARLGFRIGPFRTCPIIKATRDGRATPKDVDAWLSAANKSHVVVRS